MSTRVRETSPRRREREPLFIFLPRYLLLDVEREARIEETTPASAIERRLMDWRLKHDVQTERAADEGDLS